MQRVAELVSVATTTASIEMSPSAPTPSSGASDDSLRTLAHFASQKVGAPLLLAVDEADLDARIEDVLEDDSWPLIARLGATHFSGKLSDAASEGATDAEVLLFGAESAALIHVGMRHAATLDALLKPDSSGTAPEDAEANRTQDSVIARPLGFVSDLTIPVPVKRLLLSTVRATPAILALSECLRTKKAPSRWLGHALAVRWASGIYALLRLVASAPGSSVPETIVPARDRLDLAKLHLAQVEYRRRVDESYEQALADRSPTTPAS